MKSVSVIISVILLFIFFLSGCAGSDKNDPSTPEIRSHSSIRSTSAPILWGYYDVSIDLGSDTIEVTPNRTAAFTLNVVKFLNEDPSAFHVSINGKTTGPDYVDIDVDVTISHPMDDPGFDGYDVRGILIGDGSGTMAYNSDLKYPSAGSDQVLLNADGYTRWWNPSEFFVEKIFGYVPGSLASPGYKGTATLNAYKYFGEWLDESADLWEYLTSGWDPVGYFLHDTLNTRKYVIRFYNPGPVVKYAYAVTATWSGLDEQFHPSHCPEAVGLNVTNNSNIYFVNPLEFGGNLILSLSVFDWESSLSGGVMEDYNIIIESTVLSASYELNDTEMTPKATGWYFNAFDINIPADEMTKKDGNELWVIVEYPEKDYSNPLDVPNSADDDPLTACFRYFFSVASGPPSPIEVLNPNGGEKWHIGCGAEIRWEADIDGNVKIEYSKDSFVSDIHTIVAETENDGSYWWSPLPNDESDSVRIRVSSVDDSEIRDLSDDEFRLVHDAGWAVTWGGVEYDIINGVAATPDCSLYTVSTSEPLASKGTDTVLTKWSSSGEIIWDLTLGPGDYGVIGRDVVTDNFGNSYICGQFEDTIDFDPGDEVELRYSNGYFDAFIVKFNSDGEFQWVTSWGGPSIDTAKDIDIDGSGNILVAGEFYDEVDFDPGPYTEIHDSGVDDNAYIVKYSSTGAYQWTKTWGGDWWLKCFSVAVTDSGDVYAGGSFKGMSVDFDPGPEVDSHATNGWWDAFVTKFSASGSHLWVKTWGGVEPVDKTEVRGIDSGVSGHLWVTGLFDGAGTDFDPGPGENFLSSIGDADVFLCVFDSDGNSVSAGSWGGSNADYGIDIACDNTGNAFVTGFFEGMDIDFDPGGGTAYRSSNGYRDSFLSAFDLSGAFKWVRIIGGDGTDIFGVPQPDGGLDISSDSAGNIYHSGYFNDVDVEFAPPCGEESDLHSIIELMDGFLIKYLPDGCW